MHFKVTARTILQLGAELISSDAVAFYELIKNAFDAGSPNVQVKIVIRLDPIFLRSMLSKIEKGLGENSNNEAELTRFIIGELEGRIDSTAHNSESLKASIRKASSLADLQHLLEKANYIQFIDTGEGMSLSDLADIYLTVGTSFRRNEKKLPENIHGKEHKELGVKRPILGEKGLGRLSVMRLGDMVTVKSTKKGEPKYNLLQIDWTDFSRRAEELLSDIDIEPYTGEKKSDKNESGTTITIYKLNTNWTEDLFKNVARHQLSKFIDPFSKKNRNFIELWFNKEPIVTTNINKLLFDNAHAKCSARLEFINRKPVLVGNVDYMLFNKNKQFELFGDHLESASGGDEDTLKQLGPFKLEFYWFNNRIVKAIDGIGKLQDVRDLIKEWAGGVMVYRDGFRIFPYGGFEDDWLKLDDTAFSSGGYKVNRRQVVGKVDISAMDNPRLVDQTNREGLRDCSEKQLLIKLLQYIMWTEFKAFLQQVEKDRLTNDPIDLDEIEERMINNEQKLTDSLDLLVHKFPDIRKEKKIIEDMRGALIKTRSIFSDAKVVLESYEQRKDVTLHLAGVGLMVEIVAHELNRSTKHALDTLNYIDDRELSKNTQNLISNLQIQLKTIGTRLKVLDPVGPSGRNVKTTFDLNTLAAEVFSFHENQFKRHGISWTLNYNEKKAWNIHAVKGMFVQIFENLISNSVYWLKVKKKKNRSFSPSITLTLNDKDNVILFADNGPGIPKGRSEEVFLPFVSTKPPGDGKGLGLYISREIAKFHKATLYLLPRKGEDTLNTFVLDLNPIK